MELFYAANLLLLFLSSYTAAEGRRDHGRATTSATAMFIFGDSYFDAGNNNYINTTTLDQANFPPYGESYFKNPTGRFSDGRLISDFIAEYAKVPLILPYLQPETGDYRRGVNFASAGAGALEETFRGSVIDLNTQLSYYFEVITKLRRNLSKIDSNAVISKGVYLFSIGTNDYLTLFLTDSDQSYFPNDLVKKVINNMSSVIMSIYKKGGRKFGFLNLGDLGCFPGLRVLQPNGDCLKEATLLAKLHNEALHKMLYKMQQYQLEGFKYSLFDFSTALRQRMKHSFTFELKEGRDACCGAGPFNGVFSCGGRRLMLETADYKLCENPRDYVFWDSYHLTEAVYGQMAAEWWNGSSESSSNSGRRRRDNYNLKALFQN